MKESIQEFLLKLRKPIIALFILCTVSILVLTLIPTTYTLPSSFWSYDKLGHALMFFVWTILFSVFLFLWKKEVPKIWMVLLFSTLFGLSIEVIQYVIPAGRSAEFLDFTADTIGTLSGIAFIKLLVFK